MASVLDSLPGQGAAEPSVAFPALPRRLPSLTGVTRRVGSVCTPVPVSQPSPSPSPSSPCLFSVGLPHSVFAAMLRPNLEGGF